MSLKEFAMTTEEYVAELTEINPKYNDSLIIKAFEIACKLHNGQLRKSGEPYIIHPIAVSKILANYGLDNETIIAGLLHDVVEDTDYTRDQLVQDFDERIALLVDGVTKLGNIKYDSKEEQQAENFRKMFLAMSKDIRVLIIKLADRLHNMRTMQFMPQHKQEEKSLETLEIYSPLAGRLGIYNLKFELEDLSLMYLHPDEYYMLKSDVYAKTANYRSNVEQLIDSINIMLDDANIQHDIKGRTKHLYSIYKKMVIQHKTLEEIFDLMAVRVLVPSIKDCYAVLGIVHSKWKPIPGRFKDYIAMPKPNMYQSLHTTVIGDSGEPFEIQIRTYEMHRIAEYGIAAHWKYKEGKSADSNNDEQKLAWLRQALEWQKEAEDSVQFLETMKMDLFDNQVFVFTPRGDVMELPAGSTPLDFAFKVHTDVGIKCVGAKINGKMQSIDYELNNGDIIEIVTSSNSSGPSMDWLKIAKSSQAKQKIKSWLRKANKDDDVEKGKEIIASYIKRKGYEPSAVAKNAYILKSVKEFNFANVNELYLQISRGGNIASKVGQKLIEYYEEENKSKANAEAALEAKLREKKVNKGIEGSDVGIIVQGADNLLIKRAPCCRPIPGDAIIGFITKGKGISVHRTDCSNLKGMSEAERARLIKVDWDTPKEDQKYLADIKVEGIDRKGMISDISKTCDDCEVNLAGINMNPASETFSMIITVSLSTMHQMQKLLISLRQINGIEKVYRVKS